VSYGPSFADMFRRSAAYGDKILRGARPTDLPVEQPAKFDFVLNLPCRRCSSPAPMRLLNEAPPVHRPARRRGSSAAA
jgi:hypothetical protein